MERVAAPPLRLRDGAVEAGRDAAKAPRALLRGGVVWRDALLAWGAQRAYFALLTFLGEWLLRTGASVNEGGVRSIVVIWTQWDGLDYAGIASGNYTQPWQAAFSPLFPALAHVVALPLGGDALAAALIVANLACLGALVLIRTLAEREWGEAAARRALVALAVFPTALFLAAAYTESLFLLLSAAAFLALRAHRWPLTGVLVAFATLARPIGGLLLAAVAAEVYSSSPRLRAAIAHPLAYLHSLRATPSPSMSSMPSVLSPPASDAVLSVPSAAHSAASGFSAASALKLCSAFTLPAVAFAGFDLYLARRFGSVAATLNAEQGATWKRALSWPWDALIRAGSAVLHDQTAHALHAGLDLGCTLLFLALAIGALRTLPLAYGAYAVAMVVLVLVTPMTGADWLALGSNGRLLLGTLPLFFVLARWEERSRCFQFVWVTLSLLLLALYTLAWVAGAFVA